MASGVKNKLKIAHGQKLEIIRPMTLNEAVFQLYHWQYHYEANRFYCMLFDLIQKADPVNFEKLKKGFPEFILAYDMWNMAGNCGDDLFKQFNIPHKEK